MKPGLTLLCRFKDRPVALFGLALALLLLLWLLSPWLFGLLVLYLGLLVLLGLLGLMRLLQAVLRRRCAKAAGDDKGSGSAGHPPSRGINTATHFLWIGRAY